MLWMQLSKTVLKLSDLKLFQPLLMLIQMMLKHEWMYRLMSFLKLWKVYQLLLMLIQMMLEHQWMCRLMSCLEWKLVQKLLQPLLMLIQMMLKHQ